MIALGADHGGYKLKEEIKRYLDESGIEYKDYGTNSEERTDYPIYAKKVAEAIQNKECDCGILVCRSGYGMTVVANKFKGIRAASIHDQESAKFAKADDDINVVTLFNSASYKGLFKKLPDPLACENSSSFTKTPFLS